VYNEHPRTGHWSLAVLGGWGYLSSTPLTWSFEHCYEKIWSSLVEIKNYESPYYVIMHFETIYYSSIGSSNVLMEARFVRFHSTTDIASLVAFNRLCVAWRQFSQLLQRRWNEACHWLSSSHRQKVSLYRLVNLPSGNCPRSFPTKVLYSFLVLSTQSAWPSLP
jgi:hypothetical protein